MDGKKRWMWAGIAGLAAAAAIAGACGGGGDSGSSASPGAGKTTAAATAPTGNKEQVATADGVLTLIAKNTLWDYSKLKAKPGAITIVEDNQDAGVVHNVHVYKGDDNKGQDMGMTELAAGPVKAELKLTVEKGDYFLVCDAHPATMSAKLDVE